MDPNNIIDLSKMKDQDQIVALTINEAGDVTNMQNLWEYNPNTAKPFDKHNPCDFSTPVDKGRTVKWIGLPDSNNTKPIEISIDYVLMINGRGKQILKSKTYNRDSGNTVLGKVKKSGVQNGDIEDYYIIYSVNGKAYILDPRLEGHGF